MPQYKKAFDIGTYTGNGGQYRVGIPTLRGVGPTGTQIAGSLRFRASNSSYITRTPGVAGDRQKFTISFWMKKATIGSDVYLAGTVDTSAINGFGIHIYSSDYIELFNYASAAFDWRLITVQAFKDNTIWRHIVVSVDTTQATAANRVKLYVDGTQITSFSPATYPTQNFSGGWNNTTATSIGRGGTYNSQYFDGYLSQIYNIDGQQLTPSSFGEYNSDGIWVPKAYSGTYGTNGFYLPMNSSSNYATDQSGNGNNFTPTGFNTSTANTTYDLMTDSPTDYLSGSMSTANNAGNYASLSYYNKSSVITLSNGNLYFTGGSFGGGDTFSQIAVNMNLPTSGKWYFEFQPQSTGSDANTFGFNITRRNRDGNGWPASRNNPGYPGYYSFEYGLYLGGGSASDTLAFRNNYVTNATTTTVATGVVTNVYTAWYGVAIDCDSSTFQMYRNGVALGSGATSFVHPGTDAFIALMKGDFAMAANFGQQPFGYGVPSGYKALNTYNINRPTDSSLWFYGDTPDLMWIKNRSTTGLNTITDTVRGPGLNLVTSSTAAQTSYPAVTEINKFGMSVINDATSIVNGSGNSMVYWGWKKGTTPGFDIQTYTGDSNNNTLISHSLGVAPSFFITKNLDGYNNSNGFNDWSVYHTSLPSYNTTGSQALYLHSTNAAGAAGGFYQRPTSTKFTPNQTLYDNVSGKSYIAYLWAAIPGYSAFGSYTGTSSTDGPFVYTGFRPKWVMVKPISGSTDLPKGWKIFDAARNSYNVMNGTLDTANSNAEYVDIYFLMDFTSNGFKVRTGAYGEINGSGNIYIYAAFAEIPFKFARAR